MSENTKIEWATHTFNPWTGCRRVSPGCLNCYMFAFLKRFGRDGTQRKRTVEATWRNPVKWNRQPWICDECGTPHALPGQICMKEGCDCEVKRKARVFPSLCDWLDDEVPIEWLADFLKLIHDTPNLDWLALTKRPENWANQIHRARQLVGAIEWVDEWINRNPPANVWIGTSVEDRPRKTRFDELRKIPANVRFLSLEPLLEDLGDIDLTGIHWVIVGGESGPGARPCNVEWIRSIVRQCKEARVPCFVKQLGSACTVRLDDKSQFPNHCEIVHQWDDKQNCEVRLNHKKGGEPAEWPEDLRVREFPTLSHSGDDAALTSH